MEIRGASLFVKVMGAGQPLALMHGGPGADHHSMLSFARLADQFTLVFYDHRCNGRSTGADVTTLTFENVTADADALRAALGFERWAVLGHSFGGMVALEYALRYPDRVTRLVLADTCGDIRWAQEEAPAELARRGYPPETVRLAERFFNGQIEPGEMLPAMMKFGGAYYHHRTLPELVRMFAGGLQVKMRPEAMIYAFSCSLRGWSVMDRLGEIRAPTLVMAGRQDFQFPPAHQAELAAGIPGAQLCLFDHAGHNAHDERTAEVVAAVRSFLAAAA
jgi:proline iminopeptidase